ncbi:hypothetical protein V2J09_014049 [Rumex salicifolius]
MRSKSLFLLVWGLALVNVVAVCTAQDYTLIEEGSHNLLCKDVNVMKVNGSIPGPTLNLTYAQTVTVNVINNANHGFTIHWHGVKQPRNPWSDGPEYVTQCPIQPGKNFTYEIILSDEEGTLWWHAHSDWSRATIYGAIVIHPGQGRQYPYSVQPDVEQEIILGTWFEKDVMDIVKDYLENGEELPISFAALTMNGLPGDGYDNDQGCLPEMFEMEVESGKTYLLRIINAAMNEDLVFAVGGHNLTVVGTDAAYIEPIETDHIMITSGQTMDVLFVANQATQYYYMEAKFVGFGNTYSTRGLVKYESSSITDRVHPDLPDSFSVANFTHQFVSLNNTNYTYDVPQTVDTEIFMTAAINSEQNCTAGQNCTIHGGTSLSNITFVAPKVDVLQAYYLNMTSVYTTDFPQTAPVFDYTNATGVGTYSEVNGTRVFVVDYNSTVEMVFQGTNIRVPSGVAHPIHVHGYSFYSVGWGYGNHTNTSVQGYNLVDPPLINTVALPASGWAAIRFRANNPGVWFIHCHLERHSFTGMDAVMIVKNGTTTDTSMLPPPYTPTGTCT